MEKSINRMFKKEKKEKKRKEKKRKGKKRKGKKRKELQLSISCIRNSVNSLLLCTAE